MSLMPPSTTMRDLFLQAEADLAGFRWRPEVSVTEIPAPQRIAPSSAAIQAHVTSGEVEVGNGRLVLLHDPAGNDAWEGTFRLVSFAKADVDPQMASDPLLPEVGWSWLNDALNDREAPFVAASGTVTSVVSRAFGQIADEPERNEVEIRASWTPLLTDGSSLTPHLRAWQDLLCMTAGLPALPDGIVRLAPRTGLRPL